MSQVKIGPNFFRNEFRAYSNWQLAFAREFLQNSVDAGASHIDIVVLDIDIEDGVLVTVTNDGDVMTEDTLVNKLLALGESGKAEQTGAVGAFGQAKNILYFAQQEYTIWSGTNLVEGSGGDYTLRTNDEHFDGTKSIVLLKRESGLAHGLAERFKLLISMIQRPDIKFTVNGDPVVGNLKKGCRRREFSWGTVYTNNSFQNLLIVRIGGVPMFTKYVSVDKCVLLELSGTSIKTLTSNRDGLQYKYADQLDEFMRELSVDRLSALRTQESTSYIHYRGDKLVATQEATSNIREVLTAAYANVQEPIRHEEEEGTFILAASRPRLDEVINNRGADERTIESSRLPNISTEFIIKNELGMVVPAHYLPENFGTYSKRLMRIWASLMLEVHTLFQNTEDFAIGFILDENAEAEFEVGDYGTVFYVNPCVLKKNSFGGRSLANRWKFNAAGKAALLLGAVHEYTHRRFKGHDEAYAASLTDNAAVVFANAKRFSKCFR